jgi:hypothetical protein
LFTFKTTSPVTPGERGVLGDTVADCTVTAWRVPAVEDPVPWPVEVK